MLSRLNSWQTIIKASTYGTLKALKIFRLFNILNAMRLIFWTLNSRAFFLFLVIFLMILRLHWALHS